MTQQDSECIRMSAPYDDPAFEALCREMGIWGTAQAALCAVFWRAGHALRQATKLQWGQRAGCDLPTPAAFGPVAHCQRDQPFFSAQQMREYAAKPEAQRQAGHVGDSAFESWYSEYSAAHKGDKQRARDAYAAGMGDQRQAGQELADYAEARVQADRTARRAEQGPCGWMQNIDKAMQEPLFQALRGVMGTENMGQDMALLQTIRHYRAKTPSEAHRQAEQEGAEQSLGLYAVQADAIRDVLDKHAPETTGNLQTRLAQVFERQAGQEPVWRHVANEWADMATNGIQYVRNIQDGITTCENALTGLLSDLKHCQDTSAQAPQPAAQPAPDEVTKDLALLVWRNCEAMRQTKPESDLPQRAIDFVNRAGLTPSPLRSATQGATHD